MLQDVYDVLLQNRLEPRWVRNEIHVEVHGRLFMLMKRPGGVVGLRTLATSVPVMFDESGEALAAMGLGMLDATG